MSKIKLNAPTGGGSVSLEAPSSTTSNADIELKLPVADGSSGQAITTNGSGQLAFATVSSAIQTTSGTDNFTIADGNLVIGTSGHGIDFSATADGSGTSTSELFSDYEVGTWTPAFSGLSNTPVLNVTGKYVKVGSIVYLSAYMQATGTLPTFTTTSDPLTITGIPYTANGTGYANAHGVVSWSSWNPWGSSYNETPHGDTTGHILVGIPDGTNTRFYVSGANNTQRGRVKNNALHNSGYILEWSITYQTTS